MNCHFLDVFCSILYKVLLENPIRSAVSGKISISLAPILLYVLRSEFIDIVWLSLIYKHKQNMLKADDYMLEQKYNKYKLLFLFYSYVQATVY